MKNRRSGLRIIVLGAVFTSLAGYSFCQPSVGISVVPELMLPVGQRANSYQLAVGCRLEALVQTRSAGIVTPLAEVAYSLVPLALQEGSFFSTTNLSLLRAGIGLRVSVPIGERLSVFARGHASGYFGALLGGDSGQAFGLSVGGSAGAGFLLSNRVLLRVESGYEGYVQLFDGFAVSLAASVRLLGPGSSSIPRQSYRRSPEVLPAEGYIRFQSVELERVFPVLYKYYDTHPIGSAIVVNEGSSAVEDVEIRLKLSQFMDVAKISARIELLEPGEEQYVDIYALFTEELLSVTEGARVAAEMTADYRIEERRGADSEVVTLLAYNRNAMQWDDDKKIAAFVTARDEEIQRYARNVASIVRDRGIDPINREFQLGMAILEALDEHGLAYVVDPTSAYAANSENPLAIDTVQFPRQTLQFRAGDCDDLSATYAALLEAVGVNTAFVTVPGHIYVAFKTSATPAEAAGMFNGTEDVIFRDDGVWIPVETTVLQEGFLQAWATGAREWREHSPSGNAGFLPVLDSWLVYEPVAFGVADFEIDLPPRSAVEASFDRELERFIDQQIYEREKTLIDRLSVRPGDIRIRNRLAVLYGRYGKLDAARAEFERILETDAYAPALLNLGNLSLMSGDFEAAYNYYARAIDLDDQNGGAILGMARVNYELERYGAARAAHAQLSEVSPELAERFSYLGAGAVVVESGRASDVTSLRNTMVWGEE